MIRPVDYIAPSSNSSQYSYGATYSGKGTSNKEKHSSNKSFTEGYKGTSFKNVLESVAN